MSSTLGNSPIVAHDALPRYESKEIKPKSSNASMRSTSASNRSLKDSPRGRSAWKAGSNDYLDGLRALPEVRPIPWAPGKELPPEKSTQSTRTQTRGAFLLSTRGNIRDPPCSHCATGVGRFLHCISLDSWFHGACATCQMGTRGNLCTLRTDVEGTSSETKLQPTKLESSQFAYPGEAPGSSLKRKRESLGDGLRADAHGNAPYTSPYAAVEHRAGPRLQSSPYTPSPSNTAPPTTYSHDDPSALVNYIYKKQNPPNGIPQHQVLSQVQRETPASIPPASAAPQRSTAEATKPANQSKERELSTSLSPSAQLLDPLQYTRNENRSSGDRAVSQPELRHKDNTEMPLIDTLPRKKQKQIFGIIGGLQSGIRSVRQQADSLQKQLDLLQAALGIDGDGDDAD